MIEQQIETILSLAFPIEIANSILTNYINSLGEYRKENWQYFGNEIGQFVECGRRLIEYKINGTYTDLKSKLTIFNETVLIQWENASTLIPEEYRIIIPRVLYSMYCIRNKRGMVHKNHIDPNRMDATLLLYNSKWVLAELVRLSSTLAFDETYELVNSIMNRETSIIWNAGSVTRILDTKINSADKVLCLLYLENNQTEEKLFKSIEYSNRSKFREILKNLHKSRMVEYSDSRCQISPLGIQRAEKLIKF